MSKKPAARRTPDVPAQAPLSWPRRILLADVGALAGNGRSWIAAVWLGAGGVFLSLAWVSGPQQRIEAWQYRTYTGHASGSIVDRWVALEVDLDGVRNPEFWRASARVSPCAVVAYEGDWGAGTRRRAYCGSRLSFGSGFTLASVREVTSGVPFAWARDARSFAVPEIRLDEAAYRWLAARPAVDTFLYRHRPAKSILDELRFDLDDPIDAAVAGWIAVPVRIALAYDPRHPDEALPEAVIAQRVRAPMSWIALIIGGTLGVFLWIRGMQMMPLVTGLAAPGRWILIVASLATLPWWGAYLPQALARFNTPISGVIRDMLTDIGNGARFVDSSPDEASLAHGHRLVWDAQSSASADAFDAFRLEAPVPAPRDADAALAALATMIASQAAALDDDTKAALFARLERHVDDELDQGLAAFLPAARDVARAKDAAPEPARAAQAFVRAWSSRQHLHASEALAHAERERLAKSIAAEPGL